MATHSSIPAWRIPRTEEPGGLQSTGLQRVGHNWVTNTQVRLFATPRLRFSRRQQKLLMEDMRFTLSSSKRSQADVQLNKTFSKRSCFFSEGLLLMLSTWFHFHFLRKWPDTEFCLDTVFILWLSKESQSAWLTKLLLPPGLTLHYFISKRKAVLK